MKTQETCKHCGYTGMMHFYVKFFASDAIAQANALNVVLPKFGFHYGSECPKCKRWQKWEKQDERLTKNRFYEEIDEDNSRQSML